MAETVTKLRRAVSLARVRGTSAGSAATGAKDHTPRKVAVHVQVDVPEHPRPDASRR